MASHSYTTAAYCQFCAAQGTKTHCQKLPRMFPASEPIAFLAMDILDPLPNTRSDNQHVVVLTDEYKNLTMAILVTTVI